MRLWDDELFSVGVGLHVVHVRLLSGLFLAGIALGLLGLVPRIAALLTGGGTYVLANINAVNLHTLFLLVVWAIAWIFVACGSGNEMFALHRVRADDSPRPGSRLPRNLVAGTLLASISFSGLEKLLAGWPGDHLFHLLSYPRGGLLRDWMVGLVGPAHAPIVQAAGWAICLFELAGPVLLLLGGVARACYLVAYQLFFLAIFGTLAIPPLAFIIYAAGGLLLLDDSWLERFRMGTRWVQNSGPANDQVSR